MISHVAFLRAINTGKRRVANDDLADAVRALGFADVAVYQASGNVLLGEGPVDRVVEIADVVARGLTAALGYEVPAIVRTADEVHAIVAATPFGAEPPPEGSKPQIILMSAAPDAGAVAELSTEADRLAAVGTDIHWRPTAGISTSDLDVRGLEAMFGTMTVRTLGTIERISARIS